MGKHKKPHNPPFVQAVKNLKRKSRHNSTSCTNKRETTRAVLKHTAPPYGCRIKSGMTAEGKKSSPQVSGLHQKGRMRNQHTKSEPAERSSRSRKTIRPRSNVAPSPRRSSRPPAGIQTSNYAHPRRPANLDAGSSPAEQPSKGRAARRSSHDTKR